MKHISVSKQMSTDSIINPHDYYPFNPKRYNINACAPALTQESKLHVNRSKSKDSSHKSKLSKDNSITKSHYNSMQSSNSNNNMGPLRVSYQRQGSSRSHSRQISTASNTAATATTTAQNNNFISSNNISQIVNSNINNRLNVSMLYSFK